MTALRNHRRSFRRGEQMTFTEFARGVDQYYARLVNGPRHKHRLAGPVKEIEIPDRLWNEFLAAVIGPGSDDSGPVAA